MIRRYLAQMLERIVPTEALTWDWDRPFAEDPHIWRDARVIASLPKISELLPMMKVSRGELLTYPLVWRDETVPLRIEEPVSRRAWRKVFEAQNDAIIDRLFGRSS